MPILAAICASDSPSRAQPSIRVRPSGSNHCSYFPGLAIVNPLLFFQRPLSAQIDKRRVE